MRIKHFLKLTGLITALAGMLSSVAFADLVSLANLNTDQFVAKSVRDDSDNDQLQALLQKGRNQPLSPAENQQLQQLLLASGKNAKLDSANTQQSASNDQLVKPVPGASLQDQAFAGVTHQLMPMTPEQIKLMKQMYNERMQASLANPTGAPKPVSSSMYVNLAPGATPPVVRCASGFISTLVFLDATGEPWPVQAIDNGDPQSYNVHFSNNSLMLQALTQFQSANIAVMLKGLSTPLMITLMPGQKEVDYRVDMRIPKMGPNASQTMSGLPLTESPQLLNILDGVPPADAKEVQVTGGDQCQAWVIGAKLYLRTRMNLVSPSWISTVSSADGTHAYELEKTPVLLALLHGNMVRLSVEE
ncbi:MAG: hypothetical protein A3F17_04235 [Gammaproteobacteria bacterium RIFCSPHIGHO2_12_FULL_41_15]|nr:MAG: hypothetical protein A3F17_04235 [Gammaproteobacteria bacterium RIFCSPHIGHO2_12_FULL_41_15]